VLPAAGLDAPRLASTLAEALAAAGPLRADIAERLPAVRASARRAVELTLDVPAGSRLPA
jgi:hypothetical protein